jgi:sodium-independent sulfate anion transporter 11
VTCIDTTGLQALEDMKKDIQAFAGERVMIRFVGMNPSVRTKFEMFGWKLMEASRIDEMHLAEA